MKTTKKVLAVASKTRRPKRRNRTLNEDFFSGHQWNASTKPQKSMLSPILRAKLDFVAYIITDSVATTKYTVPFRLPNELAVGSIKEPA
mmetsp:Transcript_49393/g.74564  ORF Transcript_49393/g.74564 Transcript_49393/m.74564 type:complete len:89 (-) Transcript_49393:279-545(-)